MPALLEKANSALRAQDARLQAVASFGGLWLGWHSLFGELARSDAVRSCNAWRAFQYLIECASPVSALAVILALVSALVISDGFARRLGCDPQTSTAGQHVACRAAAVLFLLVIGAMLGMISEGGAPGCSDSPSDLQAYGATCPVGSSTQNCVP